MKQPSPPRKARPPATRTEMAAAAEPSRDAIAQRAYELYLARGRTDGHDLEDWLEAEHELRRGSD
jgi:hypothetical protein